MSGYPAIPEPVKRDHLLIYFLSAPADQAACVATQKFLSQVIRDFAIPLRIYSDSNIPPGEDAVSYKEKLYEADIVLAFASVDFISNEDIYQRTAKVIGRYNKNETELLVILVRNFLFQEPPFKSLTILPSNKQPIKNTKFWATEDDAFTSVAGDIYKTIKELVCETPVPCSTDPGAQPVTP